MTDFNNDLQATQNEVVRLRNLVTELCAEIVETSGKSLDITSITHTVKYGDEMLNATQLLTRLQETTNALTKSEYVVMALRTESQELNGQLSELRAKPEVPDFTQQLNKIVAAEVEQRIEKYMESIEFERAIEECLGNAEIRFARR